MSRRALRRGFSVIEVLLGAVLAGLLLLAAAVAISGMIGSVKSNEQLVRARHGAAATLDFMLGKIRRAKEQPHFELPDATLPDTYYKLTTTDAWAWDAAASAYVATHSTSMTFQDGQLTLSTGPVEAQRTSTLQGVKQVVFRSVPKTVGGSSYRFYVDVEMTVEAPGTFSGGEGERGSFAIFGSAVTRAAAWNPPVAP